MSLLARLRGEPTDHCGCSVRFADDRLHVDASSCPSDGRLSDSPACRRTVIGALTRRDARAVHTRTDGVERTYDGDAGALLVAAGRFADAVAVHDERLADVATSDPLRAAHDATGRAGAVGRLAAETGLAEGATGVDGYEEALSPFVGPTLCRSRIRRRPPDDARLRERRDLDTDAVVRIYDSPADELGTYHLLPVEHRLDDRSVRLLGRARDRLVDDASGGRRGPGRAVRAVATPDDPVETLRAVLCKHTRKLGVLTDFFADDSVSDVYATASDADALRVCVDGESMRTNVRLTEGGRAALASRFRRVSGRAFSRANPTLDAAVELDDRQVRVAGVTEPVGDGLSFAFRAGDRNVWTLPALVSNGTLPPFAGALLSLAVERGAATLVAGPRGAGKTTLLGALLWELPAAVRTVVIEDTPELPLERLRAAGRDVQGLHASFDGPGTTPTEALRTALRLGEGALVVGEIRGEEASALYEAMRVGANASAVLGTIHGDGGEDVRERVVADLGVPESSFAATDLLVTLETSSADGGTDRRLARIEEVVDGEDGVRFAPLLERTDGGCHAAGRIDRGNSRMVAELSRPDEAYAEVRNALHERQAWLETLADGGRTSADAVVDAHARRRERDRAHPSDERADGATTHE